MNDSVAQVFKILRLLWNRRWLVLGIASLVCAAGWPFVYSMPNKYEVTARVYLNTESMLTPLLRGLAVNSNSKEKMAATTRRTLLSRPNLEKVIRDTDMDLGVHDEGDVERLLADLTSRIDVSGRARDGIYSITFSDSDPVLAKNVVDILLSIFMETTLGVSRGDTGVTERFLEEQIQEYEARLTAAEERLKDFKQRNIGLMPSDAGGYFQRLQVAEDDLQQAQLELDEAIKRRDELQRQIKGEAVQLHRQSAMREQASVYDARILAMESRLDELLLQYTERHPDVVALEESIEELKRRKREDASKEQENFEGGSEFVVAEELRVALSTVEAEVSGLNVRVAEYQRRVSQLRSMVDTIPEVEAEYARLNRDYNINRTNYDELVNRRESAKISRDADQSVDDIQFQIIDPPIVPAVPTGPNRPLLYTVVLILGLGAGVAVAWGLAILRPSFYEQQELREFTGLPVFGTVSLVMDKSRLIKRRMNVFGFACAGLALLFAYGALIFMQVVGA